jgi:hypothetical protein
MQGLFVLDDVSITAAGDKGELMFKGPLEYALALCRGNRGGIRGSPPGRFSFKRQEIEAREAREARARKAEAREAREAREAPLRQREGHSD